MKVVKKSIPTVTSLLSNNFPSFLFNEIRYELNGVEIYRCKNVGITSTMKNLISLKPHQKNAMENAGWNRIIHSVNQETGFFSVCLPLKNILGFCEDYRIIIANARHELILIRTRNDRNCYKSTPTAQEDVFFQIQKLQWRLHHITPSDLDKLNLL